MESNKLRESYLNNKSPRKLKDMTRMSNATFQGSHSQNKLIQDDGFRKQEQNSASKEMNTGRTQYAKVDTSNFMTKQQKNGGGTKQLQQFFNWLLLMRTLYIRF